MVLAIPTISLAASHSTCRSLNVCFWKCQTVPRPLTPHSLSPLQWAGYRTGLGARRLARCRRHLPAHRDGSAGDGFDAQRHRAGLSDGPDRGYPSRQWLSASGTRIPRGCFDGKEIMRSSNRRRLVRNRKFVDSPLEGTGFELLVRGRSEAGCRAFLTRPVAWD